MTMLEWLDYFGVFVFAISGALVAVRKGMDVFGMLVLALMPAIGGGTLRDVLLGVPVFWLEHNIYLLITGIATAVTALAHPYLSDPKGWLSWADALGLAVFSVLGCVKALAMGMTPAVSVAMGVITAVAGGVIRDMVANDVPYILQREIYATAALIGAAGYWLFCDLGWSLAVELAIALALAVRSAGIVWELSLPRFGGGSDQSDQGD